MLHHSAPSPRLVVGHPDPEALRSWLSPFTQEHVSIVGSPLADRADERGGQGGPGVSKGPGAGAPIVALPYDGPLEALSVVVRAIRAERLDPGVVVAPLPIGTSPPPLEALLVVAEAGLRPGAELSSVAWVTPTSVWWTDAAGPRFLPIAVMAAASSGREVARLLAATRGFDPSTTAGRWLEAVAQGASISQSSDWSTMLAVHFIETVVARLASGPTGRVGTVVTADVLQAARAGRRVVAARRPRS